MMNGEQDIYSDRAREAFYSARDEARRLNSSTVGTEHLLLGLARDADSVAGKILTELGITFEQLTKEVDRYAGGKGAYYGPTGEEFTPGAKMAIRAAVEEAQSYGNDYVGPEHILLGLILEGEGIAARVLRNLNVTEQRVREEFKKHVKPGEGKEGTPEERMMAKFTRDLTQLARQGKLDPVVGRAEEIERLIQILSRRTKNNPILIGDPGVGKTAIVEGLALQVSQGAVPEVLRGKKIVSLDFGSVVAGAKYRGEFEERFKGVIDNVIKDPNSILFIDEIHTLIGGGAAEGSVDAANLLKPALARGEIRCIGATTIDEYRKHIEKDAALERRFQPIMVEEPSVEDTITILNGIKDRYEAFHRVGITPEAVKAAAELSARYLTDRFLPDKAVDLIDEAAARVRLAGLVVPPDLRLIENKLHQVRIEKEAAFNEQNFERVANLGIEEKKLEEELAKQKEEWEDKKARQQRENVVTPEDIAEVVSRWSGIPVTRLTESESQALVHLEEEIHKRVIGQDPAVQTVAEAVRAARAGLSDPNKPVGVFLFLGPTGVGKTELAKSLAAVLYRDEHAMVRIDMSEYMEKHTVARLIGAPPGYIGHEEGGQLTEAVRRHPYTVVLLDEIEKAHPDVWNVLLQVMDDGRLTDSKGRTVNFRNAILIMTSNIGARMIMERSALIDEDPAKAGRIHAEMRKDVMGLLRQELRPEFLNRIDSVAVFHALTSKELNGILDIQLAGLRARLAERQITLELTEAARRCVIEEGSDVSMGARPLKRAIQRLIVAPLANKMLAAEILDGAKVVLDEVKGELVFRTA